MGKTVLAKDKSQQNRLKLLLHFYKAEKGQTASQLVEEYATIPEGTIRCTCKRLAEEGLLKTKTIPHDPIKSIRKTTEFEISAQGKKHVASLVSHIGLSL